MSTETPATGRPQRRAKRAAGFTTIALSLPAELAATLTRMALARPDMNRSALAAELLAAGLQAMPLEETPEKKAIAV